MNQFTFSAMIAGLFAIAAAASEIPLPSVFNEGVNVPPASQTDDDSKCAEEKWFLADETKVGLVAEYLVVQRNTAEEGQEKVKPTEKITSFQLKYIQAKEAFRIVQQLFGRSVLRAAVDERTNSLIVVSVDPITLSKVTELLEAIDSPAAKDLALPQPAQSVDDLRHLYNEHERRARELASSLHESAGDQAAAGRLRDELRETVRKAFEARQDLQRAELAEFTEQLQRIQQSIETRERLAQQIIDRRVEALVNPTLSWEPAQPLADAATPNTSLAIHLADFEPGEDRVEYVVAGTGQKVYVSGKPFASLVDIAAARVIDDARGKPAIEVTFRPAAAERVAEVTQQHLNKPVAILVNGKLLSALVIRERFGGVAVIVGQFSREEAEAITQLLDPKSVAAIYAGPAWGEAVDGLQLAVSGLPQNMHFTSGDTIRFRLSVRNVGREAIRFEYHLPKTRDWVAPYVENAAGEEVKLRPMSLVRGGHNHVETLLEPNAVVAVHATGILVLGESGTAQQEWPQLANPQPGEYRLRGGFMVQRIDAEGKPIGKFTPLSSGQVTFQIDEAATAEPE